MYNFDLTSYLNSNFVGCIVDSKSTGGTCQFLGHALIPWFIRKHNSVATSITKAKYIIVKSYYA
jgi:hypothetical protein